MYIIYIYIYIYIYTLYIYIYIVYLGICKHAHMTHTQCMDPNTPHPINIETTDSVPQPVGCAL